MVVSEGAGTYCIEGEGIMGQWDSCRRDGVMLNPNSRRFGAFT